MRLTDQLNEERAFVDQLLVPVNLDLHLHKHLGFVQVADEQHFSTRRRNDSQWALATILIPVGEERQGFNSSEADGATAY